VHVAVSTGPGWLTVIVALVNAKSLMSSDHCGLGQPGAPAIGVVGGVVVTVNDTVPFLISDAGIAVEPVTVIGAGFCPGGWVPPLGWCRSR
jgi:hypothetical protein